MENRRVTVPWPWVVLALAVALGLRWYRLRHDARHLADRGREGE